MADETTPTTTRRPPRWRRVLVVTGCVLAGLAVLVAAGVAALVHQVTHYVDPWEREVVDAGYVQKSATVGEVTFSYVEGPDNGDPLVLLHAQLMDWFDYSRVMPDLAERYHVFVVDYQGHGETTYPADYPMTANRIGADLGDFVEQVVGEPAYVSGNSSGGLLTLWLAANRPELVRAVVLEDPPLLASEYPRIKETVAIKAFASSAAAVEEGDGGDFLMFWLDYNAGFFDKYVFPGSATAVRHLVDAYRDANPGEPTEIGVIPDETVRLMMRGLEEYDPRFGAAFYDGSWNAGFDHAEALAQVTCPVLLVHADHTWTEDGLLDGAMSQDDADRVMSLLQDGTYLAVDAGHVVHLDEPEMFVEAVDDFFLGGGAS